MLSKCSNPDCSAQFLYLHTGKLFRMARRSNLAEGYDPQKKGARGIEFFWLCKDCAEEFTLKTDVTRGVHVVSLHRHALAATASL